MAQQVQDQMDEAQVEAAISTGRAETVLTFVLDVTPFAELSKVGRLEWCQRASYVLSPESNKQFGQWTQRSLARLLGIGHSTLNERLSWSRDVKLPSRGHANDPVTALGIAGKLQTMSFKLAQRLASQDPKDEGSLDSTLTTVQATIEVLQAIDAAIESRDLEGELAEIIEMAARRSA